MTKIDNLQARYDAALPLAKAFIANVERLDVIRNEKRRLINPPARLSTPESVAEYIAAQSKFEGTYEDLDREHNELAMQQHYQSQYEPGRLIYLLTGQTHNPNNPETYESEPDITLLVDGYRVYADLGEVVTQRETPKATIVEQARLSQDYKSANAIFLNAEVLAFDTFGVSPVGYEKVQTAQLMATLRLTEAVERISNCLNGLPY